MGILDWIYADL